MPREVSAFLSCTEIVLPLNLKDVLSICVQVVNFIRGRPLHHRLFELFCEKMGNKQSSSSLSYRSAVALP